ncbi:hypothetical protein MMC25_006037 [Agyrium rufum]|nr:hypothetical protein [Agyrium rufum]
MNALRFSRAAISRTFAVRTPLPAAKCLSTTAFRQADILQDLYLRELKSYKPPAIKATDHEGHVQAFTPPKPPTSPEESNLAADLKSYETQTVEVEGQAGDAGTGQGVSGIEGAAQGDDDWFVDDYEEAEHDDGVQTGGH